MEDFLLVDSLRGGGLEADFPEEGFRLLVASQEEGFLLVGLLGEGSLLAVLLQGFLVLPECQLVYPLAILASIPATPCAVLPRLPTSPQSLLVSQAIARVSCRHRHYYPYTLDGPVEVETWMWASLCKYPSV